MIRISNTIEQRIELTQIFDANKAAWNLISPAHEHADFYDIPNFVVTKNSLHEIELGALGNIKGKRILHLQSHICVDSISLAKKGALVAVVDFSKEALQIGKKLSDELNEPLDFVEDNVLNIGYENQFDIVFLSYGALCWIPDLEQYFKLIHRALKKGGFFFSWTFIQIYFALIRFMVNESTIQHYRKNQFMNIERGRMPELETITSMRFFTGFILFQT